MKRNLYLMYSINFLQGMVFYASVATLYRQAAGVCVFQITFGVYQGLGELKRKSQN